MHLTPTALEGAIRLLDEPTPAYAANTVATHERGGIVETPKPA
ncbi:hypothetical protein ENSA5_51120 [Enhygromyxa salina]|uniref:Uncharacterized protein n=1 Tax=Enhygromyxa salina TaxID=215803 RepID=A0A2S9XH37_9BACT|nr:hypothetical protein [Enhygromyxa salina]PRP92165.1 hypothetical protein ENSA5_51120 [Enhygromyxa salina]